jgi:hypothetical protein
MAASLHSHLPESLASLLSFYSAYGPFREKIIGMISQKRRAPGRSKTTRRDVRRDVFRRSSVYRVSVWVLIVSATP